MMNEQTTELIDQLKDKLLHASDDMIVSMIREARDESLREAKVILKERMLQAILESAAEDQPQKTNNNKKPASSGGTWFQPQPSL